jgi:glycosyltransferase involved in cell wall biosynthesis
MTKVVMNTRCIDKKITGVPRYAMELLKRLPEIESIEPNFFLHGAGGHLWEQLILPTRLGNRLLFSPANIGPVFSTNQVVTIHDIASIDLPELLNPKFSLWYKTILPYLVRRVRHIIAISEFTKKKLIKRFNLSSKNISVIYNGVDEKFKKPKDNEIRKVLLSLKIPTSNYILSLGSLEPRKNLKRVLKAWEQNLNYLPNNLWLVIAGDKGNPDVFKKAISCELPRRVYLTGYVADNMLPALISGAMFFIYMSIYEGFGLPPLEAMSCGVPVLTGDRTSIPEVVGRAGLYANPYDVNDIARQMIYMVNSPKNRAKLVVEGLKRARLFSWDICTKETSIILSRYS